MHTRPLRHYTMSVKRDTGNAAKSARGELNTDINTIDGRMKMQLA